MDQNDFDSVGKVSALLYAQWAEAERALPGAVVRKRMVGHLRGVQAACERTAKEMGINTEYWRDRERKERHAPQLVQPVSQPEGDNHAEKDDR
jgi:hypothetical protein